METVFVGILSAAIAALVAWHGGERQVRIRNVTEERAKWRDRIRELAMDLADPENAEGHKRTRAVMGLRLLLNPFDPLDREIVALVNRFDSAEPTAVELQRLSLRLQLLLKHDWERAKREASWTGTLVDRMRAILRLEKKPRRPDYRSFKAWRERQLINVVEDLPPD